MTSGYDPNKFYFITVRHPVSQYVSLFRFGLDGKGALFTRLNRSGHAGDLYREGNDGFNRWLGFVLDPANAEAIGRGYARAAHLGVGLQTYRFLFLALRKSNMIFQQATDHDDLIARYRAGAIPNLVIRNENLSEGLRHLATDLLPQHFWQNLVKEFLADDIRVNAAKSSSADLYRPRGEVHELLQEKEKFLLQEFYS